jgi:uncharacterized membrane protein YbhN (UPF0104 family)
MAHVMLLMKSIGPAAFIMAAGIYIASVALSSVRWRMLVPGEFTFWRLFSLYMIGAFFSSFLPGVVGGDAVRAYYLNKDARKIGLTLASVFMDRYLGFVSLMLIGITAYPFSLDVYGTSPYKWLMPGIFLAFIAGSVVFFGLKIGRRFGFMSDVYEYFSELKDSRSKMIKVVLLSSVIQVMNFVSVLVLASRTGESIPMMMLAVFLPIIITITSMPISISGLGVREVSFVVLLGLIGIRPETATSISLAWFISIFLGSLPGLIFYFFRNSNRQPQ